MKALKTFLAGLIAAGLTLFATAETAAPIAGKGTWEQSLEERDLNGDGGRNVIWNSS